MSEMDPYLGDYYEGTIDPSKNYRWASWLQGEVVQAIVDSGYNADRTSRDDIAHGIVSDCVDKNGLSSAEAFDYLHHWRSIYNRGYED